MQSTYHDFLNTKTQLADGDGFDPVWMPDALFDFQQSLVEWAIRRGRSAIFADCGLGKTIMQLVWAENVLRHTGKRVLILTPLSVSQQTKHEAEKFGINAEVSRDGSVHDGIVITNYERLHYFNAEDFAGAVCDESSILKNFGGVRRKAITEFMRTMRYRLLCTATAAPNDFIELGTSSEALGELGHMDMLSRFFKNDDKTLHLMGQKYGDLTQKGWRFKSHAERPFWRWICSWARACRKPSDIGFSDDRFVLPPLEIREHNVKAHRPPDGMMFDLGAKTTTDQREEQRRTVKERCDRVVDLLDHDRPAIAWCNLNDESTLISSAIDDAVEVSGSDSDEAKEDAFTAFIRGDIRVLVTKPKIGGFGLNFQHCADQTFFPSHSFEQWYQCVRRSWRFGQTKPVHVDIITTDGSHNVMQNLKAKAEAADQMFEQLVEHMNNAQHVDRTGYGNNQTKEPSWL
jgi:KaiC/GvpD/RAD55 family RecA-like ATPase